MIQKIDMNSEEFVPSPELVLVKVSQQRMEQDKVSAGGIVISQAKIRSVNDRPSMGTVVSVGLNVADIEPGDCVVFPNTDGQDVQFNDSEETYKIDELAQFIILRDTSIIGRKTRCSSK